MHMDSLFLDQPLTADVKTITNSSYLHIQLLQISHNIHLRLCMYLLSIRVSPLLTLTISCDAEPVCRLFVCVVMTKLAPWDTVAWSVGRFSNPMVLHKCKIQSHICTDLLLTVWRNFMIKHKYMIMDLYSTNDTRVLVFRGGESKFIFHPTDLSLVQKRNTAYPYVSLKIK